MICQKKRGDDKGELWSTYPLTLTEVRTPPLPVAFFTFILFEPEPFDTVVFGAKSFEETLLVSVPWSSVLFLWAFAWDLNRKGTAVWRCA